MAVLCHTGQGWVSEPPNVALAVFWWLNPVLQGRAPSWGSEPLSGLLRPSPRGLNLVVGALSPVLGV